MPGLRYGSGSPGGKAAGFFPRGAGWVLPAPVGFPPLPPGRYWVAEAVWAGLLAVCVALLFGPGPIPYSYYLPEVIFR